MSQQMSRRTFLGGGALAGLSALGLAACGGGSDAPASDQPTIGDSIVMISTVQNDNFSPFASVGSDKPVQHALFDNLFMFDAEGDVVPMLVESVEEDGLVKKLKLREDAVFTSGNPLKASDVEFSFSKLLEDPSGGPFVQTYLTSVKATGDYTLEVTAANAAVLWKNFLAESVYVVEEASFDPEKDYVDEAPVGSGAYTLDSVDAARTVTLVANEAYWGGAPEFKTVQVKAPVDGATSLVALQTGEADYVTGLDADNVKVAREDDALSVTDFQSWSMQLVGIYVGDEKFREAVFHAINRQNIIDICNDGAGEPATDMLSKRTMGEYAGIVDFVGYDLDLAKQCIAESQTDLSQTFELLTFDSPSVAQCIQEDLKQIGVNVQISQVDANTFFSALTAGTLQLFIVGLGTDLQTCDAFLKLLFGPASIYKYPISDEFKAQVDVLSQKIDAGEDLTDSIRTICEMMAVECPIVPLYDIDYHDVYRTGIGNVLPSSSATYVYYLGDLTREG